MGYTHTYVYLSYIHLEPQGQPVFNQMDVGETPIFQVKIGFIIQLKQPLKRWLFWAPGMYIYIYLEPKWPLFWLKKALFWRVLGPQNRGHSQVPGTPTSFFSSKQKPPQCPTLPFVFLVGETARCATTVPLPSRTSAAFCERCRGIGRLEGPGMGPAAVPGATWRSAKGTWWRCARPTFRRPWLKMGWESVSLMGLWISKWLRVLKGLQNPRVKQKKITYLYRYCIVVLDFQLA